MKVQVKLMATLRDKLPRESKGVAQLDLDPGATVQTVLDRLDIGGGHVHVVMVNDAMEIDRGRALAEGDNLVIIPPVAGG
jgi:molybdopterin converting factor small subunit